jgi:hypothetical protein
MSGATEIVELLQSDSNTIGQSEYTVTVPPGTVLNPGDVLSMEKAFLDTSALGSQKIPILDDIQVDVGVGYYMQCVRDVAMDLSGGGAQGYAAGGATGYVDCKTYVLMEEKAAAGFVLPGIHYRGNDEGSSWAPSQASDNDGNTDYFGMDITLQYTNPAGNVTQTVIHAQDLTWTQQSATDWQSGPINAIQFDKTQPVYMKMIAFNGSRSDGQPGKSVTNQIPQPWNGGTTFTLEFHVGTWNYKGDYSFSPSPSGAANPGIASCRPFTQDTELLGLSVTIPKGNYSEADLAAALNDGFQRDYATTADTLRSAFLLKYNRNHYPNTIWVEENKSAAFETTAGALAAQNGGILIGATQMEMSYDDARAKFLWNYAHSPYLYGPQVATEAVGFVITADLNDPAEDAKPKVVSRNSGVFFTSLRAKTISTGQPYDLWHHTMGFDFADILVKLEPAADVTIGTRAFNQLQMPESLAVGQYTTENFPSLSMMADPRNPGTNWWFMPDLTAEYMTTASDQTVPIFASAQDSAQDENNSGYYLISVSTRARGNFKGADGYSSGSIIGVVGSFYSKDSYTAGSASDAIGYVHEGPPLALDSFMVRLLGPNKQPSRELGSRNCVMLRITRAGVPPS